MLFDKLSLLARDVSLTPEPFGGAIFKTPAYSALMSHLDLIKREGFIFRHDHNPSDGSLFEFNLNDGVVISISCEHGVITGRCEYDEGDIQYQVHYKDSNRAAKTAWFSAKQLHKEWSPSDL